MAAPIAPMNTLSAIAAGAEARDRERERVRMYHRGRGLGAVALLDFVLHYDHPAPALAPIHVYVDISDGTGPHASNWVIVPVTEPLPLNALPTDRVPSSVMIDFVRADGERKTLTTLLASQVTFRIDPEDGGLRIGTYVQLHGVSVADVGGAREVAISRYLLALKNVEQQMHCIAVVVRLRQTLALKEASLLHAVEKCDAKLALLWQDKLATKRKRDEHQAALDELPAKRQRFDSELPREWRINGQ
jgi:hypothetical protein